MTEDQLEILLIALDHIENKLAIIANNTQSEVQLDKLLDALDYQSGLILSVANNTLGLVRRENCKAVTVRKDRAKARKKTIKS